ncbi:MAG TPA: FAD-binding oxidoreductase [Streptosporangiaceae bacterium]|nr:FAD-binding oxidoreductase [Streptosporangiaceae bacterium]
MSAPSTEGVRRLQESLGARVCLPGSAAYSAALNRVFFPDAARRMPACVVEPASAAEVATIMKLATAAECAVTVRGGGLSSSCVSDNAVMVDLSTHLDYASAEPGPGGDLDRVTVGGGATMGTLLDAAADAGRMVPAGVVRLAGLGQATRGGVGFLTRSLGLTLDHLVAAELVLPTGDTVQLSAASTGTDADLWWAVRGCAPQFGVVTRATFRTHPARPVFVDRLVTGPDALPAYFQIAPGLPRHTSMSAVLGTVPDEPGTPGLLVYTVCASGAPADVAAARQAATAVAGSSAMPLIARKEQTGLFNRGFPELALLYRDGSEPEPVRPPAPGRRTDFFFGKSVFLDATPGADVAAALAEQLRTAPTPACRIDLQHAGGALADVPDTATAFWGRGAEWNAPVSAITADLRQRPECVEWARQAIGACAAHAAGVYSVELRPGLPETGQEVQAAFGANLPRLRRLARDCDPAGVLGRYAPLG